MWPGNLSCLRDRALGFQQNKTLAESKKNGVDVYLFEVFHKGKYTYIGKVELAEKPYQDKQPDENGELRSVWVFPVRLIGSRNQTVLPIDVIRKNEQAKQRAARKLSIEELEKRAQYSSGGSSVRWTATIYYQRNQYVAELAKRRAKGICQLCEHPAPFLDKSGEPYLESHHIKWLANGGPDNNKNVVALCPNCHTKMHVLDLDQDKRKLRERLIT